MKWISCFVIAGFLCFPSCGPAGESPAEETETETESTVLTSEQYLQAYADSLNTVGDSLQEIYRSIYDQAAIHIDSARSELRQQLPRMHRLQDELDALSQRANDLLESNAMTQEDFQMLFEEVDLSGLEETRENLIDLGFDL